MKQSHLLFGVCALATRSVSTITNNSSRTISSALLTTVWLIIILAGVSEAGTHLSTLLPDRQRSVTNVDGNGVNAQKGAGNQKAFHLSPDGKLNVTVRCHPEQLNYITFRLWSEDSGSRFMLNTAEGKQITSLDHKSSGEIAPEQWYYSTRLIPRKFTKNRKKLQLQVTNATDQSSRGIYEITIHTSPRYRPGDHVRNTGVVKPYSYGAYEPPSDIQDVDMEALAEKRIEVADKTATYIMSLQRYASDWREKVKSGKWWGPLVGGFSVKIKGTLEKSKNATAAHYKKRDNCGPLKGTAILAHAYTLDGGKYEGDPEVLERIAVGLDYMRRAQGANGGYVDVHSGDWVGGPDRGKGDGVLEGRMHRAQASAIMMIYDDLKDRGMLDEPVDDDADPDTPPVPRRQAYRDLLVNSLSYMYKTRGHAPNQEMMNVNAMLPLYKGLKVLGTGEKLDVSEFQKKLQQRVAEITGLKPVGLGDENPYWISPKGISMELGGMSFSNYGIVSLWGYTGLFEDERLRKRALAVDKALSHFWYPVYHEDRRIDLRQQEAWSRRGRNVSGGSPRPNRQAALEGVSSHVRAFQLKVMAGEFEVGLENIPDPITGYHPHGWHRSLGRLKRAKSGRSSMRLLKKLRNTDAPPLPHEKGHPDFAWVDPVSGAVSIKHEHKHIFMSLKTIDGSGQKRAGVFEVTPRAQRRSVVYAEAPHGVPDDLTLVQYGSLFIAVNGSSKNTYSVDLPGAGGRSIQLQDMISGNTAQAGSSIQLGPRQSVVFRPEGR